MITLRRLYQISVIVVLAFALIMSSPGKEAKAWSRYARCPMAFSNALSQFQKAGRGVDLEMKYCYSQYQVDDTDIYWIHGDGADKAGTAKASIDIQLGHPIPEGAGGVNFRWSVTHDEEGHYRKGTVEWNDESKNGACIRALDLIRWWMRIKEICQDEEVDIEF